MTDITIITFSIFLMGVITVILSIYVSYKFYNFKKHLHGKSQKLSMSISMQLLGEAVIGAGTLVFAAKAYLGTLPMWPIEAQSLLRVVMFLSTSLTTVHLAHTLKKIENSNDH